MNMSSSKRSFKRFLAGVIASFILASFIPVPVSAIGGSLVNVISATNNFDPTSGQVAYINYRVSGPEEARDVMIKIRQAIPTSGGRRCNDSGPLVNTIEGPVTRPVGDYMAVWSGRNALETAAMPSGLYCYQLRWGNAPYGSTALREGLITVNSPGIPGPTPPPPPGGGTPGGGTGPGYTPPGPSTPPSPSNPLPDITHSVNPAAIDPTQGQVATISYTVNRPVVNGLTLAIRDMSGRTIIVPSSTTYLVNIGYYQVNWNGRYNTGTLVPVGTYRYVFTSSGTELGSGYIQVSYTTIPPPGVGQFIVSHSANPPIFNPLNPSETTTISYTLGKNVSNFQLSIMPQGGSIRRILTTDAIKLAGSYTRVWDGVINGALAAPGLYTYMFEAAGETPVTGTVTVSSSAQNPPVITDLYPAPNPFNPDITNTIFRYQLNQDARVDLTISSGGLTVRRLLVSSFSNNGFASITNTVQWNGQNDGGQPLANGVYNYTIEARNGNGVAISRSGTVTIARSTPPTIPVITDLLPSPNPFNPLTTTTSFSYQLNQDARVDITIFNGSATVRRLLVSGTSNNGFANTNNAVPWNGQNDSGQLLADGVYTYTITASNGNGVAQPRNGTVTLARTSTTNLLTNVYADPNPFNPETQNTFFRFNLSQNANVTITVTRQNDGTFVKTVTPNQFFYSGNNQSVVWNGADQYGNLVAAGVYSFRIDATHSTYGTGSVTANVTVNRSGYYSGALQIVDSGPVPNPFNPQSGQRTAINFNVNMIPGSYSVNVYRSSNNQFIDAMAVSSVSSMSFRAEWDGLDNYGNLVSNDTYMYRIEVTASNQTVQRTGYIYVNNSVITTNVVTTTNNVVTTTTTYTGNCGNFTDVSNNHYLCPALDFVRSRGIFVGYPDGTIGLERVIQRAELLAVVQRAFNYSLDAYNAATDRNLGYRDLNNATSQWFMPHIKTFSRLGIMVGYPDRRMRPERTMSTAELYLVFLKAAMNAPGGNNVYHFQLYNNITTPPFIDTPVNNDTYWYLRYAEFARINELVTGNRFRPDRGITRGQVIQLIYDTNRKGLITYGAPLSSY